MGGTGELFMIAFDEKIFHEIALHSFDAMIIIDDDGKICFWNEAAKTLFKFNSKEAIGQNIHKLLMNKDNTEDLKKSKSGIAHFAQTGEGEVINSIREIQAITKDGDVLDIELSVTPIKINGRYHALGILRNITDKKKANAELEKLYNELKKKSENLYLFVAGLAHDIFGFVNTAINMFDIIKSSKDKDDISGYINTGIKSLSRLGILLEDILCISKIENSNLEIKREAVDINELIKDTYEFFLSEAKKKGLSLKIVIASTDYDIISDPKVLIKIINNLVTNAIKYTDKGWVKITASVDKNDQETASLILSVQDTGQGIKPESQEKVFTRFVSVAEYKLTKDSGLGLAIVYELVKLSDGTIKLVSEVDKGSTFTIKIPVQIIKKVPIFKSPKKDAVDDLIKIKCLIIDDSKEERGLYKLIAKNLKLDVTICDGPDEAMEILDESCNWQADMKFQAVILDEKYDGIFSKASNGCELAEIIKNSGQYYAYIPLIMATSSHEGDSESNNIFAHITNKRDMRAIFKRAGEIYQEQQRNIK